MYDVRVVERGKFLLLLGRHSHRHHRSQCHVTLATPDGPLAALTPNHSVWRHHTVKIAHSTHARMEPALQLTLQRLDFLLKGVVDADLELLRLSVLLHARLHHWVLTIWLHAHLLLEVLDEGRLVHRDAVLALQLVSIVDQE